MLAPPEATVMLLFVTAFLKPSVSANETLGVSPTTVAKICPPVKFAVPPSHAPFVAPLQMPVTSRTWRALNWLDCEPALFASSVNA